MSEHAHPSRLLYVVIFLALVIGTVLTWWIAFKNLGIWNPVVALTIACIKATLVILYFMHVRYSNKLTIVTVCAGFFWLLILITLSLSDYLTRVLNVG
ncbi:MAG TPA: cytochrome C oxidase subunit IV family protein [Verrucomicrobiae bacterium]|jgi:cytochrome c oxidase subunit 4|nr:cytochrome C oxidase subunit IV family protein [Verrucomicrobiae bacterium]